LGRALVALAGAVVFLLLLLTVLLLSANNCDRSRLRTTWSSSFALPPLPPTLPLPIPPMPPPPRLLTRLRTTLPPLTLATEQLLSGD
jgi:hypothetical protein